MLHFFFFFNDTATTEIYTLSLHDALPISLERDLLGGVVWVRREAMKGPEPLDWALKLPAARIARVPRILRDRKSTRLNSSHANISYAVFCLKKKKKQRRDKKMGVIAATAT